jgi:dethiobiotin synthetase
MGAPITQQRVEDLVEEALHWWSTRAEVIVIEGIGGLLCPLAERTTVADLAIALDYPLLIVARRGLGTLNHTLLTVEAAERRSMRVAGIVLNSPTPAAGDAAEATNAAELARRLEGISVLWEFDHSENDVLQESLPVVDWYERALPPRSIVSW